MSKGEQMNVCLPVFQEANGCVFSPQQSVGNAELNNGLVKGHAYTVTGATEVRIGTFSLPIVLSVLHSPLLISTLTAAPQSGFPRFLRSEGII